MLGHWALPEASQVRCHDAEFAAEHSHLRLPQSAVERVTVDEEYAVTAAGIVVCKFHARNHSRGPKPRIAGGAHAGSTQINPAGAYRITVRLSVLVVVTFVGGVPVSVVDVVQMVTVEDGRVAASLTVHVDVLLGRLVHLRRTFVVVVVVAAVDVLIVEVVDVAVVAYLDVSAVLAVFMVVRFGGHVASDIALLVMPVVRMVQVPLVEVVKVAGMFNRAMPAVRPMDVGVLFVDRVPGLRRHF